MEAYYTLAYLFILDAVLIATLVANYRRLRFPFLRVAALLFVCEFLRHVIGIAGQFSNQLDLALLLSGLMLLGRSLFVLSVAALLTKLRMRWYHCATIVVVYFAASISASNFLSNQIAVWMVAMTPILLLHMGAAALLLIRPTAPTQGRLAMVGSLIASAVSLSLLAWHAGNNPGLMALFYFADSIGVVLTGMSIVVIALEYVRENLREAQAERASSESRYRDVFESAFDAIITVDEGGAISDFNPQAQRIFGWTAEEVAGRDFLDTLLYAGERDRMSRVISPNSRIDSGHEIPEITALRKDGNRFPIELIVRLSPVGSAAKFNLFARDLTQQKEAEKERDQFDAQLQHTQKLESLGILAGGIAHDFNNFLGGILGFAALARESLPDDSPAGEDLEEIEKVARRASELTQQLLAYSGRGHFVSAKVHLSRMVLEMEPLLRSTLSKKAELSIDVARDLAVVEGDPSQLSQIVLNLATNAAEALEEAPGQVTIRTSETTVSHEDLATAYASNFDVAGPAVCLEVTDTGCGMDDDTLEHIFDPFFTTKFTGRGLGMAALIGIVRRHKGAVFIETTPGTGSCFRVVFPMNVDTASQPYLTPFDEDSEEPVEWTVKGVALVVDDEESVRNLAAAVLAKRGFDVITARDGLEGVTRFDEHAEQLSLVVLDLTMPKMDGAETFERMQSRRKDVPVILSSGYNERNVFNSAIIKRAAGFLQKPYTPHELCALAKTALNSRNALTPK